MPTASDSPALDAARARLADEWLARAPSSPAEITEFYRRSKWLRHDLEAWHATSERQLATEMLCHVARASKSQAAIDIGCGTGHDLRALYAAGVPNLYGIEPNDDFRKRLWVDQRIDSWPDLASAPLEKADLLVCVDVLEHVPEPEAFLTEIATRAQVGTILFEATATHDKETPLHLKANHGWQPGQCLEKHGWCIVDRADRIRIWQRKAEVGPPTASILACIYRSMAPSTHDAILQLLQGSAGWRERVQPGDALITRSRSRVTTRWWAETNDDVFLMVDDDVTFSPEDAERLVALCRDGHDIVCGAYPVHNGEHFAILMLPGHEKDPVLFGPGENIQPIEIKYAATGFMAVHRKVIDALIPTLPLCEPWSFYPFFQGLVVQDETTGDHTLLSEDWGFCEMARRLGFKVWLDTQAILEHGSQIPVSVRNMGMIQEAIKRNQPGPRSQEERNGQGH